MNDDNNPFAQNPAVGGYGSQTVDFGGAAPIAQSQAGALIKDTTTADFQRDVIEESRNQPVLIDFWAPWCGPCKQLGPILDSAVTKAKGAVKLVKMNIDEHPAIPGQMGVQSIPAVVAFVDGRPVDGFMGAQSESQVSAFIEKLVGKEGADPEASAIEDALEQAASLREGGELNHAAQIYAAILQRHPDNVPAFAGMVDIMLDAGHADRARDMMEKAPEEVTKSTALDGARARLALLDKVAEIGDPAALEERLAADENDHDARFDLAQIANASGEREKAAGLLLDIMQRDREWRDDGARKELLTFFEAWGNSDPATLKARRRLSSILFR